MRAILQNTLQTLQLGISNAPIDVCLFKFVFGICLAFLAAVFIGIWLIELLGVWLGLLVQAPVSYTAGCLAMAFAKVDQ